MSSTRNPQIGPGYGDPLQFNAGALNSQLFNGLILTDALWPTVESDHPEWYPLNTRPLNALPLGGYPISLDLDALRVFSGDYRLELRDQWGTWIADLNYWSNGSWYEAVNEPGSITFSYPRDESEADLFAYPKEVWLYRGNALYPERSFIIQSVVLVDSEPRTVHVTAEGLLSQWGKEIIRSYDSGGAKKVRDILADWTYQFQNIQPGIYVGLIDSSIGNSNIIAAAENKTLMQALIDLQSIYGGYYYVTPRRRLCWKETIGNDLGHVIRYGRNATTIEIEYDYRTINNRLVTTGVVAGVTTTVTVNELDSQAIYGIQTGFYEAPDTMVSSDLLKLATAELTRRAWPQTTIRAGVIDLSQTDNYDYEFEAGALDVGSKVTLVSKVSEQAIGCRVYSVSRNLDNPLEVQIEVGDTSTGVGTTVSHKPKKDFIRAVTKIIDYMQRQQQGRAV